MRYTNNNNKNGFLQSYMASFRPRCFMIILVILIILIADSIIGYSLGSLPILIADSIIADPPAKTYPGNTVIDNSKWMDTDDHFIHAHGGQIYEYNDTFYLIGATQKEQPDWLSEGINCYSSSDLINWKFENEILHNSSIIVTNKNNVSSPWRIERPKVLHNAKNNNFVMWFHLDTASFSLTSVGVATCSTICGNYTFISSFEPEGLASYDMGLYQDGTKGYLVWSVQNEYVAIKQLNDDYTNTSSAGIISKGPRIEGATVFELRTYYLLGSRLTGWSANAAELCTTQNTAAQGLDGAIWDNVNNSQKGCPNPTASSTTYGSQSTYVLRLEDTVNKKYVFVAMFDIWNYPNVGDATYLWLPISFESNAAGSFPSIPYKDTWKINDHAISIP
eukprot:500181_1